MSNVLDLVDQTLFRYERATGASSLGQCVWVYNRAVDIDGLRKFHQHLAQGRLSRRIERSPLPFGRHRWVAADNQSDLEIATPRPRAEFDAWLSEQANRPVDAERGPGWHLAVLPFTEGGAGVSLVVSHCLVDGIGGCLAVAEAAFGYDGSVSFPAAGSRRRWQALREDARQTARDVPAVGRALKSATAMARAARKDLDTKASTTTTTRTPAGADDLITIPTATIFVDADEWEARAQALGGTSNVLLAGVAARIAERMGRVTADGSVTFGIPVNERTADDSRANAITNVDVTIDPAPAASDLRGIRAAIKQALVNRDDVPDERWALLPLVPLLPKRLIRRWVNVAAVSTISVGLSNLGSAPALVNQPDGTDADYVSLQSLYPRMTKATMHRTGGLLAFLSATVAGRVFISVLAYQPDRMESKDALRQIISSALDDFSLSADIGWAASEPANA
jgi:hypothetical protein